MGSVKALKFLGVVFLLSFTSSSAWAWDIDFSSDQMTDKRIAAMAQAAVGAPYGMIVKCWEDDTQPVVVLATDIPYDATVPWLPNSTGRIRFDKDAALEMTYSATELGGKVAIEIDMGEPDFRQNFFSGLSSFSDSIHVQLAKIIVTIPAKDIKAKREKFFAICSQRSQK